MGYLKSLYGTRSADFIKGMIAGILEYAPPNQREHFIKEVVSDLAEIPEDLDIQKYIDWGHV